MKIIGGSPLTDRQTLFRIQPANDLSVATHAKNISNLEIPICDTVFLKSLGVSQITCVCRAPHLCVCPLLYILDDNK